MTKKQLETQFIDYGIIHEWNSNFFHNKQNIWTINQLIFSPNIKNFYEQLKQASKTNNKVSNAVIENIVSNLTNAKDLNEWNSPFNSLQPEESISLQPLIVSKLIESDGDDYYAHEYDTYIPFKLQAFKNAQGKKKHFVAASSQKYDVLDGWSAADLDDEESYKWENGCGDFADLPVYEDCMKDEIHNVNIQNLPQKINLFSSKIVNNQLEFEINQPLLKKLFNFDDKKIETIKKQLIDKFNKDKNKGIKFK